MKFRIMTSHIDFTFRTGRTSLSTNMTIKSILKEHKGYLLLYDAQWVKIVVGAWELIIFGESERKTLPKVSTLMTKNS